MLLFSFGSESEGNIFRLETVEQKKQFEDIWKKLDSLFFFNESNFILTLQFFHQQYNKEEENSNHINMLSATRKVCWMPCQQTTLHDVTEVQGLRWNVSQLTVIQG